MNYAYRHVHSGQTIGVVAVYLPIGQKDVGSVTCTLRVAERYCPPVAQVSRDLVNANPALYRAQSIPGGVGRDFGRLSARLGSHRRVDAGAKRFPHCRRLANRHGIEGQYSQGDQALSIDCGLTSAGSQSGHHHGRRGEYAAVVSRALSIGNQTERPSR